MPLFNLTPVNYQCLEVIRINPRIPLQLNAQKLAAGKGLRRGKAGMLTRT